MKSGYCIKCDSNDVHRYTHTLELHKTMQTGTKVSVTDFICFTCGYMESHISNADIEHLKRQEEKEKTQSATNLNEKMMNSDLHSCMSQCNMGA